MPIYGMWKRHQKLADRKKCGFSWNQRPYEEKSDHVHSCKVFKGHTGHHACGCGSGTANDGIRESRVGARA